MHCLEQQLLHSWPLQRWSDTITVIAVSGGADSVALLRALKSTSTGSKARLIAAHFHHELRPNEADEDLAFVVSLCDQLEIPLKIGRKNIARQASHQGKGIEEMARDSRYQFLRSVSRQVGARNVVTAHTRDDQIETVLHRILRGTGLTGLSGIPRARMLEEGIGLVRPLLNSSRCDVENYLQLLNQPFREDSSNRDVRYTRNRIRHQLLPLLAQEYNPHVDKALHRLTRLASEIREITIPLVDALYEAAVHKSPSGIHISLPSLANQPPYLVRELFVRIWCEANWPRQAYGFEQWDVLAANVTDSTLPVEQSLPGGVQIRREGDRLHLTRVS